MRSRGECVHREFQFVVRAMTASLLAGAPGRNPRWSPTGGTVVSELRAHAEEEALAESLVADAPELVVVLDALLVEQVHDVRECREVVVDVPAHRCVERAVVLVELRQTTATRGGDQPLLAPVVREPRAEGRVLVVS